jgi:2-polyprenyl-6-methoxyphenol hydroxylase-like FAD-dependent oxidoreductase
MTTETNIQTALVIGGGIAGPVTAMALQKAGIDAVVYEAYPSRADGVGGGLTLAPNGLDALDVIGIGDLVRPIGTPTTGIVMQDWKGKRLGEFGNPPGVPPMQFFYRSDLYRMLHEEAGCLARHRERDRPRPMPPRPPLRPGPGRLRDPPPSPRRAGH